MEQEGKDDLCWKVRSKQTNGDIEAEIIERSVEAVEKLWAMDKEKQQKFGIKTTK